ncbi:MAG: hypothetical protein AB7S44_02155 [Spirochaetales bacterium]
MKKLLVLMLPLAIAGGLMGNKIVSNAQSSTLDTAIYASSGEQDNNGQQTHTSNRYQYRLLEEDAEFAGLTTQEKIAACTQEQTELKAELLEAQANLDALLAIDTTNYTEEELASYNEQVAELEAQIAEIEEAQLFMQTRTRLMQGKLSREQFENSVRVTAEFTEDGLLQQNLYRYYESRAGYAFGETSMVEERLCELEAQMTLLENDLAELYAMDTTNFTEEELANYNATIADLEAQIIALNEEFMPLNNTFRTMTRAIIKASIKVNATFSKQTKYGIVAVAE